MSKIKSGNFCKCNACGYKGYAYGIITSHGGTIPWCQKCGINNKLEKINKLNDRKKYIR